MNNVLMVWGAATLAEKVYLCSLLLLAVTVLLWTVHKCRMIKRQSKGPKR